MNNLLDRLDWLRSQSTRAREALLRAVKNRKPLSAAAFRRRMESLDEERAKIVKELEKHGRK